MIVPIYRAAINLWFVPGPPRHIHIDFWGPDLSDSIPEPPAPVLRRTDYTYSFDPIDERTITRDCGSRLEVTGGLTPSRYLETPKLWRFVEHAVKDGIRPWGDIESYVVKWIQPADALKYGVPADVAWWHAERESDERFHFCEPLAIPETPLAIPETPGAIPETPADFQVIPIYEAIDQFVIKGEIRKQMCRCEFHPISFEVDQSFGSSETWSITNAALTPTYRVRAPLGMRLEHSQNGEVFGPFDERPWEWVTAAKLRDFAEFGERGLSFEPGSANPEVMRISRGLEPLRYPPGYVEPQAKGRNDAKATLSRQTLMF